MNPGRVLVVGAGLAGSAAAWHLHRIGWDVTIVDPTTETPESFLLQLDETAIQLLDDMGARHSVDKFAAPSPDLSLRWGKRRIRRAGTTSGDAHLARRRLLVNAMRDHVPAGVTWELGTALTALQLESDRVVASFDDGRREGFDFVVGADGIHSTVRRLVYGSSDQHLYRNGVSHLWFRIPVRLPNDVAVVASREGIAFQIFPYPDPETTLVLAAMELRPGDENHPDELRTGVSAVIEDLGPDLREVAAAVREGDEDVFVTRFTQVRTSSWSTGRAVLIGDAAHCIDPLSGLGAHASLLDAAVLADVLTRHSSLAKAFENYDQVVRPFIDASQSATARILEYVVRPQAASRFGIAVGGLREIAPLLPRLATTNGRNLVVGARP